MMVRRLRLSGNSRETPSGIRKQNMTTETTPVEKPDTPTTEQPAAEHTSVQLSYAGPSTVVAEEGVTRINLAANLQRDAVRLSGKVNDPLRLREAVSVLSGIVGSDFRYQPKDRTAYMAYMRMKRETASLGMWQAQQAYYEWLQKNDPLAFVPLDPIVTVHPDRLLLEVFSKDEGTYASLAIDWKAFTLDGPPGCGTTNIDLSQTLVANLQQLRGYRETRLRLGRDPASAVGRISNPSQIAEGRIGNPSQSVEGRIGNPSHGPDATTQVLDKKLNVPDTWLRGFLQVQSAATFPLDSFQLAPIDCYNVLRQLRLHGDKKGQRRGARIELVPGEPVRIVLEPWEVVIPSTVGVFKGKVARVVRVWGRRRLMLLRRLLPFIDGVDVHLMGSGLPTFWVFRAGDITLTLALTGFTAANWSQALSFDLLLPRKTQTSQPLETILAHLAKVWFATAQELTKATGLKGAALLEALLQGCQQGKLMFDLASGVYRLRPLTDAPLDMARLEYRNQRERVAHDLLVRRGAVRVEKENRIPGTGLELTGKVTVSEDRREYRPQMLLADEGQVFKAECTCTFFRKQGLKGGPCAHLIALRLGYAEQEAKRKKSGDPRQTVTVETRTFSKRDAEGEDLIQLSLERQKLKMRWGRTGKTLRVQTLAFNTVEDARAAYFTRVDDANSRGYLDATAT
jgi:predicted DNA-binding WGR domain protein